jgi:hypothetical protein
MDGRYTDVPAVHSGDRLDRGVVVGYTGFETQYWNLFSSHELTRITRKEISRKKAQNEIYRDNRMNGMIDF